MNVPGKHLGVLRMVIMELAMEVGGGAVFMLFYKVSL
jgi:hypothetical protein